jgi:hypothetical protein
MSERSGNAWTNVLVPIVAAAGAAIAGAWAGQAYDDLKASLFPDKVSGEYVFVSANNEADPPFEETLATLHSHDGVISGTAKRGDKAWTYSGYLKQGYVVLAYRSAGATGLGFGTYFLEDPTGNGREYVGYVEGNYCPERKVFRCNTVMVKGNFGGPEQKAAETAHAGLWKSGCQIATGFGETTANPCR